MTANEAQATDAVFRALASKPRRDILKILATGAAADEKRCCGGEEVCACDFAERLGLGAPTVSHHMKLLLDAGLIRATRRGTWVYYALTPDAAERVSGALREVLPEGAGQHRG